MFCRSGPGIVNIGLEGILVAGAFFSVVASGATGNPFVGAVAGVIAGALLAAILAFAATRLAVDQIVAGTGLNIVALGGAAYGLVLIFGQPGASHQVPSLGRPGEAGLIVLAFILTAALWFALFRTPWGLRVRACGENPRAAEIAGINALRTRFWAVVIGGAIAALGGVYLSLAELDLYSDGMTAGRGYIALAAVIFGRWNPLGRIGRCTVFRLLRGTSILAAAGRHSQRTHASVAVSRGARRSRWFCRARSRTGGRRRSFRTLTAGRYFRTL